MAMSREGLTYSTRPDHTRSPERERFNLVIASDLEGPHLLGDTALNVMSAYVRPANGDPNIDYGAELYGQTYEWFEENFDSKGLGQEGSDIALALGLLMNFGVTGKNLHEHALTSKMAPFSDKYRSYAKSESGLLFGVTTAWEQPHKPIVLGQLNFDGMKGTDFPIDDSTRKMKESGKLDEEMELVGKFLEDSFTLIENRANAVDEERDLFAVLLRERINKFYGEEIGISWDDKGKMIPAAGGFRTKLGEIMSTLDVIGDKRKEQVAQDLFTNSATPNAVKLAIGDGFNDRRMLASAPWSIGLNGAKAAEAAKIGVITPDISTLIEITELIKRDPRPTPARIEQVVFESNRILGDRAIVHAGGPLSKFHQDKHQDMKKEIRGKGALLP